MSKIWAWHQDIDWLTVSRNVTLTLTGGYKYSDLALQVGWVSDEALI
jgi:hypothetical protein